MGSSGACFCSDAARVFAFSRVLFMSVKDAMGWLIMVVAMAFAEPPVPMMHTCVLRRSKASVSVKEAKNPVPSVLCPSSPFAVFITVLTAPICAADGWMLSRKGMMLSLCGTVTLNPLMPRDLRSSMPFWSSFVGI